MIKVSLRIVKVTYRHIEYILNDFKIKCQRKFIDKQSKFIYYQSKFKELLV